MIISKGKKDNAIDEEMNFESTKKKKKTNKQFKV